MKVIAAMLVSLFLLLPAQYEYGHANQVILVVLDGADPSFFSLEGFAIEGECMAVFPTMTKPCHTSLLTGVYPSRHGILANEYMEDQRVRDYPPDRIEADTLFDIVKKNGKKGIYVGGDGMGAFIGRKANLSVSPGLYPLYVDPPPSDQYGVTRWIFEAVNEVNEREHPDFLCVSVPLLDEVGHAYGPDSQEAEDAAYFVQGLVYALRNSQNEGTTLIVTADHGMSPVSKCVPLHVLLKDAGYIPSVLYTGRVAFLYDVDGGVREFVSTLKGVKRVIVPEEYSQYHVNHRDMPGLILTAEEKYLFIPEPLLKEYKGMHGSFEEQDIGIYISGNVSEGFISCEQVDVAPLICRMLELETDVQFDGRIPEIQEKREKEASGYALLGCLGIVLYVYLRMHTDTRS